MKAHTNASTEKLLPLMFEFGRLLKSEMHRDGVSMPSFLHLETLRFIQKKEQEGQAPAMSDIALYLKVARPSATALVNAFVKDGVITRVADPEDRRLVRLTLSRKGSRMIEDTMQKRAQAFARVVSSLSQKDCREFARILTLITRPVAK